MTKYAAEAAGALTDVAEAGAAVTFSRVVPGTYDPATDTSGASTTTTVTGSALKVAGRALKYQALGLVEGEAPTLFFTPTTYGTLPALGAAMTWGGTTYTVRDVDPLAPDGTAIAAYLVVAR